MKLDTDTWIQIHCVINQEGHSLLLFQRILFRLNSSDMCDIVWINFSMKRQAQADGTGSDCLLAMGEVIRRSAAIVFVSECSQSLFLLRELVLFVWCPWRLSFNCKINRFAVIRRYAAPEPECRRTERRDSRGEPAKPDSWGTLSNGR